MFLVYRRCICIYVYAFRRCFYKRRNICVKEFNFGHLSDLSAITYKYLSDQFISLRCIPSVYTHPERVMNSLRLQWAKYQISFRARSQRESLNCVHYGSEYIIYGLLKNTCLDSSDSNMTDVESRAWARATVICAAVENKSAWMPVWWFIISICRFQSASHTHKETKTSNLTCQTHLTCSHAY